MHFDPCVLLAVFYWLSTSQFDFQPLGHVFFIEFLWQLEEMTEHVLSIAIEFHLMGIEFCSPLCYFEEKVI
jgi:hypothetical protein